MTDGSTPRKLMLLRHAKSSWKNPLENDHDRALNGRGRDAAQLIGIEMSRLSLTPDFVLCSTARRASETLGLLVPYLGPLKVHYEQSLYEASADVLLARLQRLPLRHSSVLVVAHNPGLEDLAQLICENTSSAAARRLNEKFPTGALAVFDCAQGWKALDAKNARLRHFITPRDVEGETEQPD